MPLDAALSYLACHHVRLLMRTLEQGNTTPQQPPSPSPAEGAAVKPGPTSPDPYGFTQRLRNCLPNPQSTERLEHKAQDHLDQATANIVRGNAASETMVLTTTLGARTVGTRGGNWGCCPQPSAKMSTRYGSALVACNGWFGIPI